MVLQCWILFSPRINNYNQFSCSDKRQDLYKPGHSSCSNARVCAEVRIAPMYTAWQSIQIYVEGSLRLRTLRRWNAAAMSQTWPGGGKLQPTVLSIHNRQDHLSQSHTLAKHSIVSHWALQNLCCLTGQLQFIKLYNFAA